MKWLASLFAAAAVVLAACNPDNIIPDQSDWCYRFDFRQNDMMDTTYGRWVPGVGYYTDENNHLGLTYSHNTTVAPAYLLAGIQKGAAGDITVAAAGTVFGIGVNLNETIPSVAPASEIFNIPIVPGDADPNAAPIGSHVNVSIQTNGALIVAYLDVFGQMQNPFGSSNCPGFVDLTHGPTTPTETVWATSMPTWTPEATIYETPTPTPTPSDTPTPAPSWSPTPTPTPTDMVFFGPVLEAEGSSAAAWVRMFIRDTRDAFSRPIGVIWLTGANGRSLEHEEQYATPALTYGVHGDLGTGPQVNNMAAAPTTAWNAISTAFPGVSLVAMPATAVIPVGSQFGAGLRFGCCVGDGTPGPTGITGRFVYMGQPTPTPTPTLTPSATRTPSRTPTPLPFTQTPAGPTFTPNPRATSLPLPYGLPGNTFRGTNMLCAYGDFSIINI